MREFLARLFDWIRRDRLERELSEELQFHRQQLERDALSGGAAADDAPFAARRQLGNATSITEDARERWSLPALEQILQDVRYSFRALRRSPAFSATVVLTLALGIGANAAMFGVVDQLIFRPFPFLRDPGTAHRVYFQTTTRSGIENVGAMTQYPRYLDLRRETSSFTQSAAFAERFFALGDGDAAQERPVSAVSATFFEFFDAPPALGRYFTPAEDSTPRGADVAVLGYDYWMSAFGGRDVRGERLQVGDIATTIIGVAPKGFTGTRMGVAPAAYIPLTTLGGATLAPNYFTSYNSTWIAVMVRRKPGVSVTQASADASVAFQRSYAFERETNGEINPIEIARPAAVIGALKEGAGPRPALEARTALWVAGVAAIVLLIACANVANLFLTRGLRRSREIAVRVALGASRGRLAAQLLIEALILSIGGGVAGLLVAQWGGAAIGALLRDNIGRGPTNLLLFGDSRTLALVVAIAIGVAILSALAPALLAGRTALAPTLKASAREGGGTYQRSRTRTALLVFQAALSVALLVGAGLFVRSLDHVRDIRLGFEPDRVLIVTQNLRGAKFDSTQRASVRQTLLATAQAMPGVEAAALVNMLPFQSYSSRRLFVAGFDSAGGLRSYIYQATTPDYFRTMGTRIVRGRGIEATDRAGTPLVAVVNEVMAKLLWPNADAIGQCFRVGADTAPCTTVVGVAETIVHHEDHFKSARRLQYYVPVEQVPVGDAMFVRTRRDPRSEAEAVRKTLQAVMPGQSYVTVRPFGDVLDRARRSWRLGASLFVAFGVLALLVAAIGLYGVVTYSVTQRMHELGVRVALGARRADILRLVLGQSAGFALAGVVGGLLLAALAARWLQPLLFEQSARDPVIYAGVGAVMLIVALLASTSPALRATRADPNAALRAE